MSEQKVHSSSLISRGWQWFRAQFVQEVPEESALCEFDCRKGQCTLEEWNSCERRLSKAAGELMPSPRSALPR
jgi:hypothetical protein